MLLGAGLLAAPAISLHMPLRGDKEVSNEQTTFRVMTFNVAGFEVESASLRYILDQDADFVVLQEASTGPVDFADLPQHVDMREELEQKYPYHSQGYHDLAILSKLPYTVYNDTTLRQEMGADAANDAEYHYFPLSNCFAYIEAALKIVREKNSVFQYDCISTIKCLP